MALPRKSTRKLLKPGKVTLCHQGNLLLRRCGTFHPSPVWASEEELSRLNELCEQDDQKFVELISQPQ